MPLLVKDTPHALQPAGDDDDGKWQEMDSRFRRDLPDEAYVGRLAYRGLIMRACPRIKSVDGVAVSGKERQKAGEVLERIIAVAGRRGVP